MCELNIETIGRIGLMFLDGDALEQVLVNPFTWDEDDTDYNADAFNSLKKSLMKIERMNPELYLSGVIWLWHPGNKRLVIPAVVGKRMPPSEWRPAAIPEELLRALSEGRFTQGAGSDGEGDWYFPIRNTANEVVGALQLIDGGPATFFEPRFYNCDPIN